MSHATHAVYHVSAAPTKRYLRHVVIPDPYHPGQTKCTWYLSAGSGGNPSDYNLAPYHPYVVRHYVTADHRCVLEVIQFPMETGKESGGLAAAAGGIPSGCTCDDITIIPCTPPGSIADCSTTPPTCVSPPPPKRKRK